VKTLKTITTYEIQGFYAGNLHGKAGVDTRGGNHVRANHRTSLGAFPNKFPINLACCILNIQNMNECGSHRGEAGKKSR
jgi:hypothetical protein